MEAATLKDGDTITIGLLNEFAIELGNEPLEDRKLNLGPESADAAREFAEGLGEEQWLDESPFDRVAAARLCVHGDQFAKIDAAFSHDGRALVTLETCGGVEKSRIIELSEDATFGARTAMCVALYLIAMDAVVRAENKVGVKTNLHNLISIR